MNNTITLNKIKEVEGVQGVSEWKDRTYINVGQATTKVWWKADGKLRVEMRQGRNSTEANQAIERLIGCNLVDRYSKAAGYVQVI
jgi:hypothetical protein